MLIDHSKEKLDNLIVYLHQNINSPNIEKIFNLLIIIDYKHFSNTGRTITSCEYFSWKLINLDNYYKILNENDISLELFSKREINIINFVVNKYKNSTVDIIKNDDIIVNIDFSDKELIFDNLYMKFTGKDKNCDILQIAKEHREIFNNYDKQLKIKIPRTLDNNKVVYFDDNGEEKEYFLLGDNISDTYILELSDIMLGDWCFEEYTFCVDNKVKFFMGDYCYWLRQLNFDYFISDVDNNRLRYIEINFNPPKCYKIIATTNEIITNLDKNILKFEN